MANVNKANVNGTLYNITDAGAVRFDGSQSLTSSQQSTARDNIGAGSAADVTSIKTAIGTVPSGSNLQGEVDDLKSSFVDCFDMATVEYRYNGYVYLNGSIQNSSDWRTSGFIRVQGKCLRLVGNISSTGANGYNLALYGENQESEFIKGYAFTTGNEVKELFFDMEDAVYIRISNVATKDAPTSGFIVSWSDADVIVSEEKESITLSYSETGYLKKDGSVNSSATDWNCTDFIYVSHLALYITGLFQTIGIAGYNVCLYDKNKVFVRGYNCSTSESLKYIDVSDAFYIRLCSHTPYLNQNVWKVFSNKRSREVVVDIDGNGDYTSILAALKGTPSCTPIRIKKGTYDVLSEYEEYYGSSFWSNYDGYSSHADDPFYRGLWLGIGREVRGEPGVVVECLYNGSNTNVYTYFSTFANTGNILLEGVTIRFKDIRYAIHDDYQPEDATITFKNIRFVNRSGSNAIGAGLGVRTKYFIENCVFDLFGDYPNSWDINYHGSNNALTTNKCEIRVTNCYGHRGCGFWSNGPSTEITTCYVSNSKFKKIVCYKSGEQITNMELIQWCNEVDE